MQVKIDPDELKELVREVVREQLAGTEDDPLLDAEEAAAHLHFSVQRVYDLVAQGRIERVGPKGTRLLLRRSTLDAFLARRRGS